MTPSPIVFLVDVDNTLLDNDRIQNDLKRHLEREFGAACRDRYWTILEQLFTFMVNTMPEGTLQALAHDSSTNNLISQYRKLKEVL